MLVLCAALTPNSIQLVNEDDGGLLLPGGCKQLTDTLRSSTDEDFIKFGSTMSVSE